MKEKNIKVHYFKNHYLLRESYSKLFTNADEIILPYFKDRDRKEFKTFPTPDLHYIYLYLKEVLLNENKNWSIELALKLVDSNDLYFSTFSSRLLEFANEWHLRKKQKVGKNFLNYSERLNKKNYSKDDLITLKEGVDIKEFFDEIKILKDNYLNCNNEQLLNLFFSKKKIEIEYSRSYLKQIFYN